MTENNQNGTLSRPKILKAQLSKGSRQPLHNAYLLFEEALFPLLARYLHRQQIRFKASARLDGQKRVLYLCPDLEKNKKTLPRFVLTYLQELPRCQLFYQLSSKTGAKSETIKENRGFLVEYGFQHPLSVPEITDHLPVESLYFIFGDHQRPALVINPAPTLKNDCDLSKPESCIALPQRALDPDVASKQPLQLKLHLTDDPHALKPIRALHLEGQEIIWLEKLWQRLPAPLLARLRWAGDQKNGFLLLPEDEDLALFPFAKPLKKIKDNLYLPLKQRLNPELTHPQLDNVLDLVPERITFLTQQWRFDIAEKDFQPLDKAIIAPVKPSATLNFSNPDQTFDFIWGNRDDAINYDEPDIRKSPNSQETEAAKNREPSSLTITRSPENPKRNPNQNQVSPNLNSTTPTKILKEYALQLRRQNDFLGAATCFSLAEEPQPAAECYRLAALSLEQQ
ncbi:MAG: hypothetical protein U9Q39_03260 [Pseudomonadota bacterium]|nr:hypothetical protein [Pseudomonadota bacterium]